jgi:hypothetical protein
MAGPVLDRLVLSPRAWERLFAVLGPPPGGRYTVGIDPLRWVALDACLHHPDRSWTPHTGGSA